MSSTPPNGLNPNPTTSKETDTMATRPCGYINCPNEGEIMRHSFEGQRDEYVCLDHYFQAVPNRVTKP